MVLFQLLSEYTIFFTLLHFTCQICSMVPPMLCFEDSVQHLVSSWWNIVGKFASNRSADQKRRCEIPNLQPVQTSLCTKGKQVLELFLSKVSRHMQGLWYWTMDLNEHRVQSENTSPMSAISEFHTYWKVYMGTRNSSYNTEQSIFSVSCFVTILYRFHMALDIWGWKAMQ